MAENNIFEFKEESFYSWKLVRFTTSVASKTEWVRRGYRNLARNIDIYTNSGCKI